MSEIRPNVGLFVTCLVDLFRPSVGFAAIALLERAGCTVAVPAAQTCCGQPAFNSGDRADAKAIAAQVIDAFEGFDYIVAPSGSCGGMLSKHYPEMFGDDPEMRARAEAFAAHTYELVSFLVDIRGMDAVETRFDHRVAYHDSCSSLREMKVQAQPRALLDSVSGLKREELAFSETCCGFGGTFCVKYPEISNKMVGDKCDDIVATGVDTVLSGDMGCLMNIAGKLKRRGSLIQVRHIAEVLAGMTDAPAIGEPEG